MFVEFGNPDPQRCIVGEDNSHSHGPATAFIPAGEPVVFHFSCPESYTYVPAESARDLARDLAVHLVQNPEVTRLPDHEAFLALNRSWAHCSSSGKPSWVWSDNDDFAVLLSHYYDCPVGRPDDLEETHHTLAGPPGVRPPSPPPPPPEEPASIGGSPAPLGPLSGLSFLLLLLHVFVLWALTRLRLMPTGGVQIVNGCLTNPVCTAGTSTGVTATSLTDTGATGFGVVPAGAMVATGGVFGIVTFASSTVLTVDRWYTPQSSGPAQAAAATPATGPYVVLPGKAPAAWVGISADTTAPSQFDNALTGEITTAGGGLVRKFAGTAYNALVPNYVMTIPFTANASDVLPVTIGSMGVFQSIVVSDTSFAMLFHSLVSPTATLRAVGDQLTITDTVVV